MVPHVQLVKVRSEGVNYLVVSNSLQPHGLQPARLFCPCSFAGKSTGVGCRFLLQGIFLTQGLNLRLLHFLRRILYHYVAWEALNGCFEDYNLNLLTAQLIQFQQDSKTLKGTIPSLFVVIVLKIHLNALCTP